MPHLTAQQNLEIKQTALAAAMGMTLSPVPAWLADSIAIQSALAKDVKGIYKDEHLRRSIEDRDAIRNSESHRRKLAKTSIVEVHHRVTSWGVIQLRPMKFSESEDGVNECVTLHFRPRALAEEPNLMCDAMFNGEFCAVDLVITEKLGTRAYRYAGPGEIFVYEGDSFLDAMAIHIVGPAGRTDWQAVGETLATIFDERLDAKIVKIINRVRNMHTAVRLHWSAIQARIKQNAG